MTALHVLQVIIGILAVYHVGMGAVSVVSPRGAARIAGLLYALEAAETPALRHGVRMLGLYAMTIGVLLILALPDPRRHVEIVLVIAGLQIARATARIAFRRDLASAFGIPPGRNALSAAILIIEAATMVGALAYVTR